MRKCLDGPGRAWTCAAGDLPRGATPPPRMRVTENGREGGLSVWDDVRTEDSLPEVGNEGVAHILTW